MKIDGAETKARAYLLEQLDKAAGIAWLVKGRNLEATFYFADRPLDDPDFVSGLLLSVSQYDKELEEFVANEKANLIAIFQNTWSEIGDLDHCGIPPGTLIYQGGYYHTARTPGTLAIAQWRRLTVGPLDVIYLLPQSLWLRQILANQTEARPLSDEEAGAIARAIECVFVRGFDFESWVGATLGATGENPGIPRTRDS